MLIPIGDRMQATLTEIQAVWMSVSHDPSISIRCIAEATGIKQTKVHTILHFLEEAGYLAHKARVKGRQVLIPLVWT